MKLFWSASRPNSRLWAASPARLGRRIDMSIVAEDGIDGGAVVGEPLAILLGSRLFAGALAELALDSQELLEQKGAPWPGLLSQEVLDAGPVAALFPVGLEAIGRLIDPGPLASLRMNHGRSPFGPERIVGERQIHHQELEPGM